MSAFEKHEFLCERATVLNHGQLMRNRFQQIIGEHAVSMVDLTMADRKQSTPASKKSLMKSWAKLVKLNDEWVSLMCGNSVTNGSVDEFYQTTHKLVHLYTEALGDYVIDRHTCTKKLEHIAQLEGEFYAALAKSNQKTMMQHWNQYTGMVVQMVRALDKTHVDDAHFLVNATKCIRAGRLLGMWLDASLS